MAKNIITKQAFSRALKELLMEQPLSKISVKDITEKCELCRNSFYYHFSDKYELINWQFQRDLSKNVHSIDDPLRVSESFVDVCKCLYNNRNFYFACLQYAGQNSLYELLYDIYYKLWKSNLAIRYDRVDVKLSEEELSIMARLDAHAFVGIITDWVKDGMHNNYMEYFENIRVLLSMEYVKDNTYEYYEMIS